MNNDQLLPEYQEYLRSKSLVKEKYITYYAYWASKFLSFSNNNNELNQDLQIKKYINYLSSQVKIEDWQIRQAHDAARLYCNHVSSATGGKESVNAVFSQHDIKNLMDKMRQAIRIRHYSYRTEQTYINWMKYFLEYLKNTKMKRTDVFSIDSTDVENYLTYLALKKRVSASTQNQAFNAILFFFRYVLNQELTDLSKTVRAKRGQRLPVVLSVEEVRKIFEYVEGTNLLILRLLYGAGLRLMEAVKLRVKDIDFGSDLIFVRDGKGAKDRTTVLPEKIKKQLMMYLEKIKALHEKDLMAGYGKVYLPNALERKYPGAPKEWPWQYVFPSAKLSVDPRSGIIRRHHIHKSTVQSSLKQAVRKAGIPKHVSVHTLRHSFATHLLMSGVNIREIQQLLGHKNVETTMIYTHVLRDVSKVPHSPLDAL